MGEMAELFRDLKKHNKEKKDYNRFASVDILDQKKIPYKKFTDDHYRVGDFNFWPSTGLYIHVKTNVRGRGVFNLLKAIKS